MLYTLTMNPSVDCTLRLDTCLVPGGMNRSAGDSLRAGGKGIGTAIVLRRLGHDVAALGFLAGHTGDIIADCLRDEGVECRMEHLPFGNTRINVKVLDTDVTEISGSSPPVDGACAEALLSRINGLSDGDMLIFSGSVPESLPEDYLDAILCTASERGAEIVADTTAENMKTALKYSPALVKVNRQELSGMFGQPARSEKKVGERALALCGEGARSVLVSMGEGGALLAGNGRVISIPAVPVSVVNTVGSGDSVTAGFISGMLDSDEMSRALRLGCAAGSATAAADWLCSRDEAEKLYGVTSGTVREII